MMEPMTVEEYWRSIQNAKAKALENFEESLDYGILSGQLVHQKLLRHALWYRRSADNYEPTN